MQPMLTPGTTGRCTWYRVGVHPPDHEVQIGARHEAGHVVMHYHHDLPIAGFAVFRDGTGEVQRVDGMPVFDVATRVDVLMAGPAAEELFGVGRQAPDRRDIEFILSAIESEDVRDEPADDYDKAVEAIVFGLGTKDPDRVLEFMLSSFARCLDVLKARWQEVTALAEVAEAAPETYIQREQIEAIVNGGSSGRV